MSDFPDKEMWDELWAEQMGAMTIKWQRIEAGWYRTEVDGVRYEIIRMQGESVRYSGVGAHWILSKGGDGDLSIGRQEINSHFSLADAKIALRWHLEGRNEYGGKPQ